MLQCEQYRKLLLAKKTELIPARRTRGLDAPLCVAEDDQAPILHDQFVTLRILSMDAEKLKLIDLALDRLEANEYGLCQDCGDKIPARRLTAIPWARLCVSCQELAGSTAVDDRRAA